MASFLLIILSIAVMGFMTVSSSQERLIDNIGQDYSERLRSFMGNIDERYKEKILGLVKFSEKDQIIETLIQSNEEFDNNDDIEDIILKQNDAWIDAIDSEELLPSMIEIQESELSQKLKSASQFLATQYNYYPYVDISILNAHGAVIANVKNPIEYHQIDADWWEETIDSGYYLGEVDYDDELNLFTQDVTIRFDDSDGTFVGMLKAKIKLQDILIEITQLKQQNMFLGSQLHLVDTKGMKIFSTGEFQFGDHIPLNQYIVMTEQFDYFLFTGDGAAENLFAYSKFEPSSDFPTVGWTLIAEQPTEAILGPVVSLTNTILIISFTTITSAVTVALYVRTSISKPLSQLKNASQEIADGNYEIEVDIKTDDEVEDLANSFIYMRDSINYTNENLHDLIKLRTEDLNKTTEELKQNKTKNDELVDFLTKQIKTPIQSLIKNIDSLQRVDAIKSPDSESITDTVIKLNNMVSELTDLYNVEQNNVEYDMNDAKLNEIINEAAAPFLSNPRENVQLKINLANDVPLFADRRRLLRVFSNIIRYSLNSTAEGYVEITTETTSNSKVEIFISDTRGKLEQSETDKIFEYQPEVELTDNTSVSLHVAKSVIKAHGGKITAAPNDADGVVVSIELPIFEN